MGPKTSPTGGQEGDGEEQLEPEAKSTVKPEPLPPDDAEIPEGVELVPIRDIDNEEMQLEGNLFCIIFLTLSQYL